MTVLILLLARLPLYLYAMYRFLHKFQGKWIEVEVRYLAMISIGAIGISISSALGFRDVSSIFGTLTAISFFLLARTARELR